MPHYVLRIRELKTYFNTPRGVARAVDGVSFDIEAGETFALVGESGCGKSVTALSAIQLVPEPAGYNAGGEIFLNGTDILTLPESERKKVRGNQVSMIFQEPMTSLNPVYTIGRQVMEPITLHQNKDKAAAVSLAKEMLARVGLPDPERLFNEYPHTLSGGMRQRVMIAMALACRPDLLIADEPTTALDVTIQAQILELMKGLQREMGTAILLITHNLALVYKNARRVGVMYAGKIVETASTDEIFRNPLHPYTIQLLKAIPRMELRQSPLETIPGSVPPATDFPAGCRFSGRCPREMEGCASKAPFYKQVKDGHTVLCHLYDPGFMSTIASTPLTKEAEELSPLGVAAEERQRPVLVSVKGLKKYYPIRKGLLKRVSGELRAVDGIDLEIRRGSTLALVGESGCGKTTAGKAIIQLIKPTAGVVRFSGNILSGTLRKGASSLPLQYPDNLPGPVLFAKSEDDGRGDNRRGHCLTQAGDASPGEEGEGDRDAHEGRALRRYALPLPA